MRSAKADSAASRSVSEWDQIAWPTVYRRVRRLQTRIAKATRDQDWRRVKALQQFLVNSFSAKALAVKRVSENDGKRTPGVDGEVWATPEAKWQAIQRLSSRGLRPQPLRRVYIPKRGSRKMRPLGIPTMIIRAQQALHLQGLEPVAETRADPHSYGFRRNRGTQDAIACVFTLAGAERPPRLGSSRAISRLLRQLRARMARRSRPDGQEGLSGLAQSWICGIREALSNGRQALHKEESPRQRLRTSHWTDWRRRWPSNLAGQPWPSTDSVCEW